MISISDLFNIGFKLQLICVLKRVEREMKKIVLESSGQTPVQSTLCVNMEKICAKMSRISPLHDQPYTTQYR